MTISQKKKRRHLTKKNHPSDLRAFKNGCQSTQYTIKSIYTRVLDQNKKIQRFHFTKNCVLTYQTMTFAILLNFIIWTNCKASGLIAIIVSSEKSNKQYGYMAQTIRNVRRGRSYFCPPTNRSHLYDTRIPYSQRRPSFMHYLWNIHNDQEHHPQMSPDQ